MSLRLPLCEFCRFFDQYEGKKMKCRAFPQGIPLEKIKFEDDREECSDGIKFEEETGE